MKDRVYDIVITILKGIAVLSGIAGFIIALGVAGRDEMLTEIGKASSFNPLPGLGLALVFLVMAAVAGFLAITLINSEE